MVDRKDPRAESEEGAPRASNPTTGVTLGNIYDLLQKREHEASKMAAQQEVLSSKIDASRAESATRGAEVASAMKHMEAQISATRHEVRNVAQRVAIVESEIADLRGSESVISKAMTAAKGSAFGAATPEEREALAANMLAVLSTVNRSDATLSGLDKAIAKVRANGRLVLALVVVLLVIAAVLVFRH